MKFRSKKSQIKARPHFLLFITEMLRLQQIIYDTITDSAGKLITICYLIQKGFCFCVIRKST